VAGGLLCRLVRVVRPASLVNMLFNMLVPEGDREAAGEVVRFWY
jgi:hypothetical protein